MEKIIFCAVCIVSIILSSSTSFFACSSFIFRNNIIASGKKDKKYEQNLYNLGAYLIVIPGPRLVVPWLPTPFPTHPIFMINVFSRGSVSSLLMIVNNHKSLLAMFQYLL